MRAEATPGDADFRPNQGGPPGGNCGIAGGASGRLTATMKPFADAMVALVALLHVYFLVLEMFLWTRPYGRRVFGLTPDQAQATKSLAANQGLYNGFLAAGLLWSAWAGADGYPGKVFFLTCVIIAGIFGAATANRKILWVQAVPGAVALGAVCLANH